MTSFKLYWIIRLDEIKNFIDSSAWFSLILGGAFLFFWFFASLSGTKSVVNVASIWPYPLLGGIFLFICHCFIPTTNEMIAIYLLPRIINNESLNNIPKKLLIIMESKVNEWTQKAIKEH